VSFGRRAGRLERDPDRPVPPLGFAEQDVAIAPDDELEQLV
jgi:hypothetical protein